MTETTQLITAPQAGQILGCSGRTVIRKAQRGDIEIAQQLPGPNGAFLFRRSDVEALLQQMRGVA